MAASRAIFFPGSDRDQILEEVTAIMKMQEVKEIAKKRGIKTANMKKADIIRAIQQAEGNCDCYDTGRVAECGQSNCLWRDDCK